MGSFIGQLVEVKSQLCSFSQYFDLSDHTAGIETLVSALKSTNHFFPLEEEFCGKYQIRLLLIKLN
jgi:hypothetical protein